MKKTFLILLSLICSMNLSSQIMSNGFKLIKTHLSDTIFYSNGESINEIHFYLDSNNFKRSKVIYSYDESGELLHYKAYHFNSYIQEILWNKSGDISRITFENHNGLRVEHNYYDSGPIYSIKIIDTLNFGYEKIFYESGNLSSSRIINRDTIVVNEFYENGTLFRAYSSSRKLNELIGSFKVFRSDGSLLVQGNYLSYEEWSAYYARKEGGHGEGVKDGSWIFYNNSGRICKKDLYDNGVTVKSKKKGRFVNCDCIEVPPFYWERRSSDSPH